MLPLGGRQQRKHPEISREIGGGHE